MIYRITSSAEWQAAQEAGVFASPDLALEGFIHCSEHHQILRTANKYFRDADALTLLEIDDLALGTTLVREDLTGSGMFPHVYSPIPIVAVKAAHRMRRDTHGGWVLPDAVLSPK